MRVMKREASDNKYLHKDFHLSMNMLLDYIFRNFGRGELIKYLAQYAKAYYKPLNQKLAKGGLEALLTYFTDLYEQEEWPVKIDYGKNYLEIEQEFCPGISHIRTSGKKPCPHYRETYSTVYEVLCLNTPFEYELDYFIEETGACKQSFKRKR